jgi:hypothetical protein
VFGRRDYEGQANIHAVQTVYKKRDITNIGMGSDIL